jgi:hypothetical protein
MHNASKLFRASIIQALDTMATDPATMTAIEVICGSSSIEGTLERLWNHGDDFGLNSEFIGTSRDQAIRIVTGKSFAYWASLHNDGKWFCGPIGSHFDCYYIGGKQYAYAPRGPQ